LRVAESEVNAEIICEEMVRIGGEMILAHSLIAIRKRVSFRGDPCGIPLS